MDYIPIAWAVDNFSDELLQDLCLINGLSFEAVKAYRKGTYETRALSEKDEFENDVLL